MRKTHLLAVVALMLAASACTDKKLSEEQVRDFYTQLEAATLERKPEKSCALLAADFEGVATVHVEGESKKDTSDKAKTCEGYKALNKSFEMMGTAMGGTVQIDTDYTIHRVTLGADKKSATVDISNSMNVGGSMMRMRSRSTETLVLEGDKVLMQRSVGVGAMCGNCTTAPALPTTGKGKGKAAPSAAETALADAGDGATAADGASAQDGAKAPEAAPADAPSAPDMVAPAPARARRLSTGDVRQCLSHPTDIAIANCVAGFDAKAR